MECKMTCSGEGTLWPLPSGAFSLSSELASFFAESSVQITLLDASQDVIGKSDKCWKSERNGMLDNR